METTIDNSTPAGISISYKTDDAPQKR